MNHNPNVTNGLVEKVRCLRDSIEKRQRKLADDQQKLAEDQRRLGEWESVLAKVQMLQREEQPRGKGSAPSATVPTVKPGNPVNKAVFLRDLLRANALLGLLPADIRKIANEQGVSVRSSYPYKQLAQMVTAGEAYKDEQGRYYPRAKHPNGTKATGERGENLGSIN